MELVRTWIVIAMSSVIIDLSFVDSRAGRVLNSRTSMWRPHISNVLVPSSLIIRTSLTCDVLIAFPLGHTLSPCPSSSLPKRGHVEMRGL